ncbi:PTS glucose transporter subunit IIA [Enterococcus hulanensis]|uniref:PTS sugar transporter subunit IIA n=1 Tax=Enterococcus hulanensis TaxID=2559929 RepID=UPI001A8D237C|nr:PTS glucose transporter subunit IIA [Enterococcus hulanensis]MBO0458237.1 PTS glucose transporter subunit IIA [Enterococcus hulanensis]
MFNFFKSKEKNYTYYAPCSGQLVRMNDIDDPVFSNKMMGDGYGIQPTSENIYSPVYGVITTIFPTKHAIGIKTNGGDEVLLHIGIDTVELEGKPFEIFVEPGDKIKPEMQIATMDIQMLEELEKQSTVVVVYTNRSVTNEFDSLANNKVSAGEELGSISH